MVNASTTFEPDLAELESELDAILNDQTTAGRCHGLSFCTVYVELIVWKFVTQHFFYASDHNVSALN